jgi:putative ABC transport system substrate-binding protein
MAIDAILLRTDRIPVGTVPCSAEQPLPARRRHRPHSSGRTAFHANLAQRMYQRRILSTTQPTPIMRAHPHINTAANNEPTATMLRGALAALGDIDEKSIRLDFRLAEGDAGRFPELAAALVRDNPSVIVANGPPAVRAAQYATQTVPIVATVNDLVSSGFIDSMARPGGNITGVSLLITELDAKRLEVLKEILPAARRIGLLMEPATRAPAVLQPTVDAARALGVELQKVEVSSPAEFPGAIALLEAGGAEAVNILSSTVLFYFHRELGTQLLEHKLPAICEWREMAAAGCLASYGTTLRELYAMQAALIDKILREVRPADTPAQQPTKFEFVINSRVARDIGVRIPPAILARADEVIE